MLSFDYRFIDILMYMKICEKIKISVLKNSSIYYS